MTKTPAMFWSGETLGERLKTLIEPFVPDLVDCTAYTLSIGPEIYVSRPMRWPSSQSAPKRSSGGWSTFLDFMSIPAIARN